MPDSAPQQCNATQEAPQRIIKIRRDYNTWVANETIEDYALRFTPRAFRKWSVFRVSNASFGAISFLVLEAIGGSIAVTYGFTNAFWAIIAVGIVIFFTGLPISYYAARHGLDMDLLTRGAGFGYIGSTISSFVYASFTFILFALEAAIMAYALKLALGMPLHIGYLVSALIVIPLVTHGVTLISRVQLATLPVWICLQVLPFAYIFAKRPDVLAQLPRFSGQSSAAGFTLAGFGAAMAVGVALVTQIGEQVDFLRFMPEETRHNRLRWHIGVLGAGPGWIVFGMLKMLGGALLALLAIRSGVSWADAVNPTHMYLAGFRQVFGDPAVALAVTVFFIVVAQVKINLTNAYAGSLAWSNFFARLTHSHPGRVVWAVFNALIAVLLMELDVFTALEHVLGLYANVAIAWIAAVVADLVINKPLGLSPAGIEFRRAYLYDINPVGVGAMLLASLASICAYTGTLGTTAQALAPVVALATALAAAPLIAWLTKGRYYIARAPSPAHATPRQQTCVICERSYEAEDTAHCPAYQGPICSLCCCLDARCDDVCKPHARLSAQWEAAAKAMLPRAAWPYLTGGLAHFVLLMLVILAVLAALLALLYQHEAALPGDAASLARLHLAFIKLFGALTLVSAIAAWWLVLTSQSRRVAQEESNRQTSLLTREIELHGRTDAQLQQAKRAADQANQAKSRYVAGLSHEIRTPLNSILGYAQLLDNDPAIPAQRRQAIQVIRSSGEHLLSLIEGTLDMARIESGKFSFNMQTLPFAAFMAQLVRMFEQQAAERGLDFRFDVDGTLAGHVLADRKRLGQILINILGNAFKFTERGSVVLRLRYQRETALFEVEDTGPGIQPDELERIFEPFSRGSASDRAGTGGTGLGLPITKVLTQLMGGELQLDSVPGKGTTVRIRLRLPRVQAPPPNAAEHRDRTGFRGPPRRVLVVDNEAVDREMLRCALAPLGFVVEQAGSGPECLRRVGELAPDLILLDLAMPGIDGWEVARLIRDVHRSQVPIAIVSANAFDKGQENPAAIPGEDFFVKPVNVNELLDWIGRKLELTWVTQAGAGTGTGPARGAAAIPPAEHLDALREQLKLGYVRGLQARLDIIRALDPAYAGFCDTVQTHASRFELDVLARFLEQGGPGATAMP
jgi:signal transduction histidine kinase/CheY-like chemotaxis protein